MRGIAARAFVPIAEDFPAHPGRHGRAESVVDLLARSIALRDVYAARDDGTVLPVRPQRLRTATVLLMQRALLIP